MIGLLIIVVFLFLFAAFIYMIVTGLFDWSINRAKESDFDYSDRTYVDKSVHHHYHDNRSIYLDGDKVLPNSDETTIDV